jgi:hypothetical protein
MVIGTNLTWFKLLLLSEMFRNWDSSVVWHRAMGWMVGSLSPGRGWEFFVSPPHSD